MNTHLILTDLIILVYFANVSCHDKIHDVDALELNNIIFIIYSIGNQNKLTQYLWLYEATSSKN